jgi:hypothetical protein
MNIRLGALALLALAAPALAETIVVGSSSDNTLFEDPLGGLSNGAGAYMFVGETRSANSRRGLIKFDLSMIPAGSTVQSVALRMHCSRTISGNRNAGLHRVLASWGEGTSDAGEPGGNGAAPTPGDATWVHRFFDTVTWTNVGGDFAPTASANTVIGGIGFWNWNSTAGLVSDAQSWVNNPSINHGWLIFGVEDGTSAKRLDTREHPTPEWRPALTVTYRPIPEPATIVAMPLLLLAARRRR